MPSWPAISGCSSMFIFTRTTAPLNALTAFSRIGASCLHGPHHGAQKSTRTTARRDGSSTSFANVRVVVSVTDPSPAGAAAAGFGAVLKACPPGPRRLLIRYPVARFAEAHKWEARG